MTGYITPEHASLPAGTDNWDVVAAFRTMANSQRTIVPVLNRAAATSIASAMSSDGRPASATNPLIVYRSDTDAIETYDGTNWWGAGGYTNEYTAWTTLTLSGTWVNYVGGGGYRPSLSARVINDRVQVSGMVKSGAGNSVICYLPTAYRPAYTFQNASCVSSAGAYVGLVISATDGSITYTPGTSPTFLSIDLSFPSS